MNKCFKKVGKKFIGIFLLFLLTLFPTLTYAQTTTSTSSKSNEYIESIDTEFNVKDNFTFDVKLNLSVNLNNSHGFIYNLPYQPDENEIKNIKVNNKFSVEDKKSTSTCYKKIKIGDKNKTVSGIQNYEITYTIEGTQYASEFHNIALNVIPSEMKMPIKHASSTVIMPKPVNWEDNLEVFVGGPNSRKQLQSDNHFTLETTPTTIMITGTDLPDNYGASLRATLDKNYWQHVKYLFQFPDLILVLSSILLILSLILWFLFGRDKKVVPVVQFFPPKNMSAAEAGYFIDGDVSLQDISSIFIEFIDKGYVELIKDEKNQKNYSLKYTKPIADEEPDYKKELFNAMFNGKKTFKPKQVDEEFIDTINSVKRKIKAQYQNLFDTRSLIFKGLIILLACVMIFVIFYNLSFNYDYNPKRLLITILLPALLCIYFSYKFGKFDYQINKKEKIINFILLCVAGLFLALSLGNVCNLIWRKEFVVILGIIFWVISLIVAQFIKRRNDKFNHLHGDLLGFREFLQVAELPRIVALVEEDPQYFYKTLPFAYVFGLSDAWVKKFELIDAAITEISTADMMYLVYIIDDLNDEIIAIHAAQTASKTEGFLSNGAGGGSGSSSFGSGSGFGGGGGNSW